AYVERSRLQVERMPLMQTPVCLARLLNGDAKRQGGLVRGRRAFALNEKLIDEKPHRPVAFVLLVGYGFVHWRIPSGDICIIAGVANALNRTRSTSGTRSSCPGGEW